MPIKVPLTCLLFLFLFFAEAQAEERYQTLQGRGLLILGSVDQMVSAEYLYNSDKSPGSSASSQEFLERYRFSTVAAIIDPHLIKFQLSGGLLAEQSTSSSSALTKSLDYEYNLAGIALDLSWHPSTFYMSRALSTVMTPYHPAYNSDSKNLGIGCTFQKGPIATRATYDRSELGTKGLGVNGSSTSDIFQINGTHNYQETSASNLTASVSRQLSNNFLTDDYKAIFTNNLRLGLNKKNTLSSAALWQQTDSQGIPQTNLSLAESLNSQLGSALNAALGYAYSYSRTTDFSGNDQLLQSNSVSASLSHRLFRNLDTQVSGRYVVTDILGGTEEQYGGKATVAYHRSIPTGIFSCSLSADHEVTDRTLAGSLLSVRDELHRVLQQGDVIPLGTSGVLGAVFSVKSRTPDITYVEGIDYTVDLLLRRITIIQGGGITPGTDLFISYSIFLDPSLKYATDSFQANTSISFLAGRYVLNGSFVNQEQTIQAGQPVTGLTGSQLKTLNFRGTFPTYFYTLEYGDYSSSLSRYRYVSGWWQVNRRFSRNSMLSLNVSDRYTIYDATGTRGGYTQNALSASASYQRALFSLVNLLLSSTYAGTTAGGSTVGSQIIFLRGALHAMFNKLSIDLSGETSWRYSGSQRTQDNQLQLALARYF